MFALKKPPPSQSSRGGGSSSNGNPRRVSSSLSDDGPQPQLRRRKRRTTAPTTVEIRQLKVHFPFRPYPCQTVYMEKVMDALNRSENALLESPTGTGKTLCLLCACLAWQREQARQQRNMQENLLHLANDGTQPITNATVPTIIYASRTHSQLAQVTRELRNTRYRPRHAVLGSREQMCVHPKVKKPHASAFSINHDCTKLNSGGARRCKYRAKVENNFTPPANEQGAGADIQPVMDMEDLVEMGKSHKVCPFYYTRGLVETAELLLVPYNYLFDKDARDSTLEGKFQNSIVIFDEAHNLESFASDSASFDLTNHDINGCVQEVDRALKYLQVLGEEDATIKSNNLMRLKAIFLQLEEYILQTLPTSQQAYNGDFIMQVFSQGAHITHANHQIFIDEVRKVNQLLMDFSGTGSSNNSSPRLEHFCSCLKRVYHYDSELRCLAKANFYRVYVSPPSTTSSSTARGSRNSVTRTVSYWCFAPALAMEEIASLKVRSILVTSGTLSPLASYSMELGLPFMHLLENPHIVSDSQIHVRVLAKGVSGKLLNSSYERRQQADYYPELGNTLVSLAKVIPAGMLVFFPSYHVMETCIEKWGGPASTSSAFRNRQQQQQQSRGNFFAARRPKQQQRQQNQYSFARAPASYVSSGGPTTIWKRLVATKSIVVEPKSSADLPDAISEFHRFLSGGDDGGGCMLMGVCRGKISEGIDFSHEQSRAVIITGLPFPPSQDAKVKMKREFLDKARAAQKSNNSSGFGGGGGKQDSSAAAKLSGHEWYAQQAHRAVNQAIGRVIRNKDDYGAVLLLDSRFEQTNNKQGLSSWIRNRVQDTNENMGVVIRSLVQFYKTAAAAANADTKQQEKDDNEGRLVLAYEQEDEPAAALLGSLTNVAVIQQSKDGGEDDYYVAPDQVLARLDVKEFAQKSSSNDQHEAEKKPPAKQRTTTKKNHDGLFQPKRTSFARSSSINNKSSAATQKNSPAAIFFQRLQELLPSNTDALTLVKKAIVAMRKSGDKRDVPAYTQAAGEIVAIVLNYESLERCVELEEKGTLFLFFKLLPTAYRANVEIMALNLGLRQSQLGKLLRHTSKDGNLLRSKIVSLLHALWCPQTTAEERSKDAMPPPDEDKIQDILRLFEWHTRRDSSATFGREAYALATAFCKLLPTRLAQRTRNWANESRAEARIQDLKQADNKAVKGEASLDQSRFTNPSWQIGDMSATRSSEVNHGERKREAPAAASVVAAKKRPQRDSLSRVLQAAESDVYIPQSSADVAQNIRSNATTACPICKLHANNEGNRDPYLAPCGHTACLGCWKSWLSRSKTCPTCRTAFDPAKLARMVFVENKPASLSQLVDN